MGKVLKVEVASGGGARAFTFETPAAPITDIYVQFRLLLPAGFLSIISGSGTGSILKLEGASDFVQTIGIDGPSSKLYTWWTNEFPVGPVLTEDTWHTIDLHHNTTPSPDTTAIRVDGVDVGALTNSVDNGSIEFIYFGYDNDASPLGSLLTFYLDDLKIGTTAYGSTDLYNVDFESGAWIPPFDSNTISGTGSALTAVDDPFPPEPASAIEGVSVAFDDTMLEANPTWTRIDNQVRVRRWEIHRGRDDEREKTGAAEAMVFIHDPDGDLDPSNSGGPWVGQLDGRQLGLARWNPITGEWFTRFRGTIEEWGYDLSPSQRNNEVAIRAVGFMAYLAGAEMAPGAAGQAPPSGATGNIFYEDAEVDDRILALLADAGFDTDLSVVFSGNVVVQETIYDPGYSFLAGIQDAADAEFPGVANVYEDRFGRVVFHGRHARFDPDSVSAGAGTDAWDFTRWKLGDEAACIGDPDTAMIRPPLHSDRGLTDVINAALAYPLGTKDGDIEGQVVTDPTSIGKYGVRSWTSPDLRVLRHKTNGNTGLDETLNVGTYYVTNMSEPQTRPRQITLRAISPDDDRATSTWDAICRVDISDVVHLTVTNPGGGGFDDDYYVEGITESSEPLGPFTPVEGEYDNATVTLDVSPTAWYNEDTFPGDS